MTSKDQHVTYLVTVLTKKQRGRKLLRQKQRRWCPKSRRKDLVTEVPRRFVLGNLAWVFQFWNFHVLIFSIINHPCSPITVYFYHFHAFYPSKLVFWAFLWFNVNFESCKNNLVVWRSSLLFWKLKLLILVKIQLESLDSKAFFYEKNLMIFYGVKLRESTYVFARWGVRIDFHSRYRSDIANI